MTDLEERELQGKVKKIVELCYKIRRNTDGSYSKAEILVGNEYNKYYEFNSAGNITEKMAYGQRTEQLYYVNNNLKSYKKYDEHGKIMYEYDYENNDQTNSHIHLKYNDLGNLISKIFYYRDGKIYYKQTWKYNHDGRKSEFEHINEDGKLKCRRYFDYEYDGDGNLTTMTEYGLNDEPGFSEPFRRNYKVYYFEVISGNWYEMEKYEESYIGHNERGNPVFAQVPKVLVTRIYDYY